MDSNASRSYLLNQTPPDHPFIDLGLSLNTFHHHYDHTTTDDYSDLIDCSIGRRESLGFVKVNMDGVIVGRKICMLDHVGYSSLVLQIEDMFGKQTLSGLRLFQPGSEYFLVYMDRDHESWMAVGDHVPWQGNEKWNHEDHEYTWEFVYRVKRLRIARKS